MKKFLKIIFCVVSLIPTVSMHGMDAARDAATAAVTAAAGTAATHAGAAAGAGLSAAAINAAAAVLATMGSAGIPVPASLGWWLGGTAAGAYVMGPRALLVAALSTAVVLWQRRLIQNLREELTNVVAEQGRSSAEAVRIRAELEKALLAAQTQRQQRTLALELALASLQRRLLSIPEKHRDMMEEEVFDKEAEDFAAKLVREGGMKIRTEKGTYMPVGPSEGGLSGALIPVSPARRATGAEAVRHEIGSSIKKFGEETGIPVNPPVSEALLRGLQVPSRPVALPARQAPAPAPQQPRSWFAGWFNW